MCAVNSSHADPAALRAVAEQLATEAAAFVRDRRPQVFPAGQATPGGAVRHKSTRTDPVTVVDTETESLVRDRLAELRPGDPVVGEEGGRRGNGGGAVTWVLDPVDGTVNFLYGIPAYAVSVAAQIDGVSVAGAVADVAAGSVYSAAAGAGAHLTDHRGDRQPLRCNDVDELAVALVGTGFGYEPRRRAAQAALLTSVLPLVRDVRRIGSAALDLCMVAAGRLDAHYEHGLNVWDWAAGALVAAESGASVRIPGAGARPGGPDLTMAAAPGIADDLFDVLDRLGAGESLPE